MGLGRWLKHAYAAISIVLLLHINASFSLGHHHYANVTARCVERERDALLAIKGDLVDDDNLLSSWGGEEEDCCRWERVHCDHQTGHVIQLHLNGDELNSSQGEYILKHFQGEISPKIIELQYLEYLNLSLNSFNASQIPALVCSLSSLKHLDLSYNDLSGTQILELIGNLTNLRYLDLSANALGDEISYHQLGNLTHLQYLNLGYQNQADLYTLDLSWLPHLSSLKYLDLSETNLSRASDWLETINKLPNLRNLSLGGCDLPPPIISTHSHINSSNSLVSVMLARNSITSPSIFKWLCNSNTTLVSLDLSFNQLSGTISNVFRNMNSLVSLDLSSNQLSGTISDVFRNMNSLKSLSLYFNQLSDLNLNAFANMSSLEYLDLSRNQLSGLNHNAFTNMSSLEYLDLSDNPLLEQEIPTSFAQLCSLRYLSFLGCNLIGKLSDSIQRWSTCPKNSFKTLHLSNNNFSGSFPNLTNFTSLEMLDLSINKLSGIIPDSIGKLSSLTQLFLYGNLLSGRIPESIGLLSSLSHLDLHRNQLSGKIPKSIGKLSFLVYLNLQKNLLSGIPEELGQMSSLETLDLSTNWLRGRMPQSMGQLSSLVFMNLSINQLEGPVPSFLKQASFLDLSHNKFSEMTSFLCSSEVKAAVYLDLSKNHISGEVPDCLSNWINLELLDLSNNSFSGIIPHSIGFLRQIKTLKLRSNQLVGEVPSSLSNCTNLNVIDLGNNHLSSSVPDWLGVSLPNLMILMLRFNKLNGSLPSQLCHLAHLQILDVSVNQISGNIPNCLNNLTSLYQERNSNLTIRQHLNYQTSKGIYNGLLTSLYYEDDATFMWKGTLSSYRSTLGLVKRIDLSSNRLTGVIPNEITHLVGLLALNLSRNKLTGQIPQEIGRLKLLDSLDLSRNKIGGGIPTGLAHIDRLGALDLSYNNLSGEIPTGTQLQSFDASFFARNPWLCGRPLDVCDPEGTGPPNGSSDQEDADELITVGFYISLGLGFAVGFWGVCASLIFKRSWRYAYYNFLNSLNDWLYVRVALIRRKLKELLTRQS